MSKVGNGGPARARNAMRPRKATVSSVPLFWKKGDRGARLGRCEKKGLVMVEVLRLGNGWGPFSALGVDRQTSIPAQPIVSFCSVGFYLLPLATQPYVNSISAFLAIDEPCLPYTSSQYDTAEKSLMHRPLLFHPIHSLVPSLVVYVCVCVNQSAPLFPDADSSRGVPIESGEGG